MASYNIGPRIGIEGESQFRQQISRINGEYRSMDSYLKTLEKSMEQNGRSQEALAAKSNVLRQQLSLQEQRFKELSEALAKAKAMYGENSQEVTRFEGALLDVETTTKQLARELGDTEDELDRLAHGIEDVGDSADAAEPKVLSFGDMLKAGIASGVILNTLERVGEVIVDIGSQAIEAAADVKAANAQFEQTFGELEGRATTALRNISEETGIAVTRLQSGYTSLYAFTKSVGGDQETALNIAQRALMAAADSAAYYDRSMEDATETLQRFLKGNYENDAALGIAATETTRNAKANELYAKSFNELSEAQKVDTLLAMVEAGNKASGALGQAAREADSWTNVTGELSEAWKQLLASLGSPILEGLTPMIQGLTDALKGLTQADPWYGLTAGVEAFQEGIATAGDALADSNSEISATAGLAQRYLERLQELEEQGLTTEAAMREYAGTIDLINQIMPELNLTIDEGTGRLEQNTQQILNNIDALKNQARQQAQQAYYSAIIEELTKVEKERYAAELRLYELQAQKEELLRSGAQAVDLYAAAEAEAAGRGAEFWAQLSEQDRELYDVTLEIQNTQKALDGYTEAVALHTQKLEQAYEATQQLNQDARKLGRDTGNGIAQGVLDSIPAVESAFEKLAKKGQGAYLHTMDQHSPSRVMRAKGKDSGLGAALGVEDSIPAFEKAWAKFAEAGTSTYVQDQLNAVAEYPSIMAGTPGYGSSTTSTRNVAYGGISININTQPGQDAQSIADAVMERLTLELGQEEAVF